MKTGGRPADHGRIKSRGQFGVKSRALKACLVAMAMLSSGVLGGCAGLVSGTKTAIQAAFSLNPTSINFGKVGIGKQTTQSIAISNTGNTTISITQATVSNSQFSLPGATFPMSLATGQSGNVTVAVTPTASGTVAGTLTALGSNGNSQVVNLSATAVAPTPQISLSSSSVQFGTVTVGSTGNSTLTISNAGTADLTVSLITLTGTGFGATGIATPKTISAGQSASLALTFQPTIAGAASASLSIASNDPATPTSAVALAGTGSTTATQAGITLTPASANLGNVTVGSSNSQTFQVKNTGNGVLTITQATASGTGFSTPGLTVPLSINPGLTSTFNAVFQPAAAGSATGSISIVSNAPTSPTTIGLSGTGVAATEILTFSTNSVAFGNVDTGSSSTQGVTITNTGNSNVQISQITVSGTGYTLSGASTPVTLTPTQSTTLSVIFSPTTTGSLPGSVTVTSNATGSPATITLTGTGVTATPHTVALSWTASTSTVSGYNVYRSTTSGTGYAKLNTSLVSTVSYTDSTVTNATTYFYVTTAVDGSGNESSFSNQATAAIP